jgi:hypothetical protein
MTDATRKCPVCGTDNPSRARFCGSCGTALGTAAAGRAATAPAAPAAAATNPILPWFIAGVCVVALQTVAIVLAVRQPQPAPGNQSNLVAPFAQGGGGAPGTTGRAPDISNMTPREAADRLYDRIARASSSGDSGQVTFFGPMALQAYSAVSPLDADARLHIGLIQLALGNTAAAAAEADSITRQASTHLFGPLLRLRVAEATGDAAAARRATQQFQANYDAERRKGLPEYNDHRSLLEEVHGAARGSR